MSHSNTDLSFNLKHWGLTLILGAIASSIALAYSKGHVLHFADTLGLIPLILIVSIPLTIPAAALYLMAGYFINTSPLKTVSKKGLLISIVVIEIFLTFKSIDNRPDSRLVISYSIAAIISGIWIKFREPLIGQTET